MICNRSAPHPPTFRPRHNIFRFRVFAARLLASYKRISPVMESTDDVSLNDYGRAQTSGFEINRRNSVHSRAPRPDGQQQEQVVLPRADGGGRAWLFLAGCFMIEALIWGFPFSFGVFQDYYTNEPPFSESPSGITVIGTSAMVSGAMHYGWRPELTCSGHHVSRGSLCLNPTTAVSKTASLYAIHRPWVDGRCTYFKLVCD